jgi:hypothetical protein
MNTVMLSDVMKTHGEHVMGSLARKFIFGYFFEKVRKLPEFLVNCL